jgi:MFS family permease
MPATPKSRTAATIAILAVTQLIGWGTTFDMLGVMGRIIAPDLHLANEIIFLGISVMMVVGALAGPAIGRMLKRFGAARLLAAGSVAFAAGLLLLSVADGLVLYILAWCVIGVGGALGLSAPAYTAVVEREGANASRVIAILMLFTGLSSAIFWPLLNLVQETIGWRLTFGLSAAAHLFVCLPLYLFALPKPLVMSQTVAQENIPAPVPLDARGRRLAFVCIAAATTLATFVTYGLTPSLLQIFGLFGAAPALALQLGSLRGVMGISARFLDMLLGRRGNPLLSAILGAGFLLTGFVLLIVNGRSPVVLVIFVVCYGFGSGIITVARALLPLTVFSRQDYGLQSARLSLPQNLASAFAPVLFTAILDRAGVFPLLVLCAVLATISVGFILMLAILIRKARAVAPAV